MTYATQSSHFCYGGCLSAFAFDQNTCNALMFLWVHSVDAHIRGSFCLHPTKQICHHLADKAISLLVSCNLGTTSENLSEEECSEIYDELDQDEFGR